MAAKSPVGIDCDEQRAELKQVLQSRSFVRAPTLAHLLSYLGEKLFAGEASQIKEYSIGVEVFHRGASFDQDSDSIVRVEANRLRKRLAEYYAGEGASHRIHIVIPVGQYVPEFILAAPGQDETRAGSEASSTTGQGAPDRAGARWLGLPGHWRWWLAGAISLLLLGLALLGVGYFRAYLRRHAQPAPAAFTGQPSFQGTEIQVGPPVGEEIRILSGASRSFVDHAGKLWNADTWFVGGTAVKSSVRHIGRTQDPDFYRTSRQGEFHYDIPPTAKPC
jgi:hypothetical protein